MKQKVIVTIAISMLLLSVIGVAFQFTPVVIGDTQYYLDVKTDPQDIVVINGTGWYTDGTTVDLEAPLEVMGADGVKYEFDEWDIDGTPWTGDGTPEKIQVYIDQNHTATAHYKTYYRLRIITPYAKPYYKVESGSWVQDDEEWFEEDTRLQVGVYPGEVLLDTDVKAVFDYWSGNASGGRESDWFNMTGPADAEANWYIEYYLDVDKVNIPPDATSGWGSVPIPTGEDWYKYCTEVKLNATDIPWTSGEMRWKFKEWRVNGTFYEEELNITVHISGPTNATVHYIRQYWIDVSDNIGGLGVLTSSQWVSYCENLTVAAEESVGISTYDRYVFSHWEVDGAYYNDDPTTEVHSEWPAPNVQAIYDEEYYLIVQDNIGDLSGVSSQSGWKLKDSTVPLGAPDEVSLDGSEKYTFEKWVKDPNYVDTNNETTIKMAWHPRNATAYYVKQYKLEKFSEPITLPGWPVQWWVNETKPSGFWAPTSYGTFVFWYWKIDSTEYPEGQNYVGIPSVTGPMTGIAYYANKTAIILTGGSDIHMYAPGAYGESFDVNVTFANFNKKRTVNGKPMTIYGADFIVDWDTALVKCTGVTLYLDDIWGQDAPGSWFVAKDEIDNVAGTYWFSGTDRGETEGFDETKVFVTLHFIVIYEPCYYPPDHKESFKFSFSYTFINHLEQSIRAEMGVLSCKYTIEARKPLLKMIPVELVKESMKQPTFEVEVWLEYGVKVHDYYIKIVFDKTKIKVIDIAISYFLPGPYIYFDKGYSNTAGNAWVRVVEDTAASAPLVNGTGLLFTVTFKVVNPIYWTPKTPYIKDIIYFEDCWISAKCKLGLIYQELPPGNGYLGIDKDTTYYYIPLIGDLNFDGKVDVLDLQLVADNYNTGNYDITGEGNTDIRDLVKVAKNFGKEVP